MLRAVPLACLVLAACASRPSAPTLHFEHDRIRDRNGRIVRMKRPGRFEDEILRYDGQGRVRERVMRATIYSRERGCRVWSTTITEEGPRCELVGELPLPPEHIEVIDTYSFDDARQPVARHRIKWQLNDEFYTDPPGSPGARSLRGTEDATWTWHAGRAVAVTVTLQGQSPVPLTAPRVAAPYLDEAEHIARLSNTPSP